MREWKKLDPKFKFLIIDRGEDSNENWEYLEKLWIKYYRKIGCLYNLTNGGPNEKEEFKNKIKKKIQNKSTTRDSVKKEISTLRQKMLDESRRKAQKSLPMEKEICCISY